MKIKEFKDKLEKLGYEVIERGDYYQIKGDGAYYGSVHKVIAHSYSTNYAAFRDLLNHWERADFEKIVSEFGRTPIKHRKSEVVYKIKSKLTKQRLGIHHSGNIRFYEEHWHKFTKKEVDYYGIDLNDTSLEVTEYYA